MKIIAKSKRNKIGKIGIIVAAFALAMQPMYGLVVEGVAKATDKQSQEQLNVDSVKIAINKTDKVNNTDKVATNLSQVATAETATPRITSVELDKIVSIGGVNYTSAVLNGGILKITFTTDLPLKLTGTQIGLAIPGMSGPPATGWTKAKLVDSNQNKYVVDIDLNNRTDTSNVANTKDFFKNKTFEGVRLYFRTVDQLGVATSNYYMIDGGFGSSNVANHYRFTIDNTKPTASLIEPAPGNFVNGEVDFIFNVEDTSGIQKVYYNIQDEAKNNMSINGVSTFWMSQRADGSWSYPFTIDTTQLAEGAYTFNIRATDNVGNVGYIRPLGPFTVDRTAPTTPQITSPTPRQWFNGKSTLNSWTAAHDENGIAQYEVKYEFADGRADATRPVSGNDTFRTQTFTGSYHGPITISVRAKDHAGNWSAFSKGVTYNYDSINPETDINVSPVVNKKITVSGTATDNIALNRVYVQLVSRTTGKRLGGTIINLIGTGESADWKVEYNTNILPDGLYAAHVEATDMAGNRGSAGWTENFIIDTKNPTLSTTLSSTVLSKFDDELPIVTINAEDSGSGIGYVQYKIMHPDEKTAIGWKTIDNGVDTADPRLLNLSPGEYILRARAFDKVGNKKSGSDIKFSVVEKAPTEEGEDENENEGAGSGKDEDAPAELPGGSTQGPNGTNSTGSTSATQQSSEIAFTGTSPVVFASNLATPAALIQGARGIPEDALAVEGSEEDVAITPEVLGTQDTKRASNYGEVLGAQDEKSNHWSLANLLATIFISIGGLVALLGSIRATGNRKIGLRITSVIVAAAALLGLFYTEDFNATMNLINIWTTPYAALIIVQSILLVKIGKKVS